jgi:hypothetical protein
VNEDVRVSLLSCLPPYLARCSEAPDAAALAVIGSGTRDPKEAVRRACLRAAASTFFTAAPKRCVQATSDLTGPLFQRTLVPELS